MRSRAEKSRSKIGAGQGEDRLIKPERESGAPGTPPAGPPELIRGLEVCRLQNGRKRRPAEVHSHRQFRALRSAGCG